MFTILISALLASLSLSASAAPAPAPASIEKRIVGTSVCTSIASGTLRTTAGDKLNFGKNGFLAFSHTGLHVEFQSCQPNFGNYDGTNGSPVAGHIYIPSTGKCLTAPNTGSIPVKFKQDDCYFSDDSGQTFSNFAKQSNGKIYFIGGTQKDGSIVFYGDVCKSGFFGLPSAGKDGAVAQFQCANKQHTVGLNI